MTGLRFEVVGLPGPQGSKRHVGGNRMIESSKKVGPWREAVANAARTAHHGHQPMDGPLSLTVVFRLPATSSWKAADRARGWRWKDRTPDLDKLLRSTGDALTQAGVIADDARIVTIFATKHETAGWTGAQIHIRQGVQLEAEPWT
jgi:Holliday junction resolvase RusA-like endonuclease